MFYNEPWICRTLRQIGGIVLGIQKRSFVSLGLQHWLADQKTGKVVQTREESGGCINQAQMIRTAKGNVFFLKHKSDAPKDMFESEAKSLQKMAATNVVRVPTPYYWDEQCLLMELIESAPRNNSYWPTLGQQLAEMHNVTQNQFGLAFQTYCGITPQLNQLISDGHIFFGHQRLLVQGKMAHDNGYFDQTDSSRLERLCQRLTELIPDQPASLIHGDLWSGNAYVGSQGEPVLIDPALYFGWREADIALTQLFGAFPESFYQAYNEAWPMEPGWQARMPVYNLYHIMNHLNIFGRGYLTEARMVLKAYA